MKTTIITPVNTLEKGIEFYDRLNFQIVRKEDSAFALAKDLAIELNADRFIRAGIKMTDLDWTERVTKLRRQTEVTETSDGYLLGDGTGTRIYLNKGDHDVPDTTTLDPSLLGNFAGMSLESTDPQGLLQIYKILGFKHSSGSVDQGWILIQNEEGFSISVMKPNSCPHLFFNPSLTFFNGQSNLDIIKQIRSSGVRIAEEITAFNKEGIADNIILQDPGGYGFFIFND